MLPLKWICCCKESLTDRIICKKDLVLFLFPHRTLCFGYLLESPHWGDSNKYPKHGAWSFNAIILAQFLINCHLLNEVSWHSNCHFNEFYRCIECRYKEGLLYLKLKLYFAPSSSFRNFIGNQFTLMCTSRKNALTWLSIRAYLISSLIRYCRYLSVSQNLSKYSEQFHIFTFLPWRGYLLKLLAFDNFMG